MDVNNPLDVTPHYEVYQPRTLLDSGTFRDRREQKESAQRKYKARVAKAKRPTVGPKTKRGYVQATTPQHQHSVVTNKPGIRLK